MLICFVRLRLLRFELKYVMGGGSVMFLFFFVFVGVRWLFLGLV